MSGRIVINGREVKNPVARFLIKAAAVLVAAAIVILVLVVVLPVVGVVVAGAVGIALAAAVLAIVAVPIFMVGGPLVGIILAPFSILFRGLFGRRTRDDYDYWD